MHNDSEAWRLYSIVSFAVALLMMLAGVWFLPVDMAMKAYFTMGTFFLTGACFTLSKTLRDHHEAGKLHNKIEEAKTEAILKEYQKAA
jgi:hypothetical protein